MSQNSVAYPLQVCPSPMCYYAAFFDITRSSSTSVNTKIRLKIVNTCVPPFKITWNRSCTIFLFLNSTRHTERIGGVIFLPWCAI